MKKDTWHITARGRRVVELKSFVPESTLFQRGELAEYIEHLEATAHLAGQERMRERAAEEAYPEGAAKRIRALEPEPLEP